MAAPIQVAVVDDDLSARTAFARLVKSAGLETVTFSSAREFLAHPNPELLGCAVIDLWMPDVDGLALQEELDKKLPHLAVVFVSGRGDIHASVRAMKAGAVDFLEKPVSEDELLNAIRLAMQRTDQMQAAHQEFDLLRQGHSTLTPT